VTIDRAAARRVVGELAEALGRTIEQTAEAIIRIAVSGMYSDVSALVSRSGIDPREFSCLAFGGAGPMMACFLARELGMQEVVVPTTPGVLSALGGLIAGHVLVAIPWTVRLITASLVGMDRAVEEAAQSLGADRLTTFRLITLPAIMPGIVAAALFGFIASFGNLEMSLFLVGPGRTTLPIAILQYLEWKIDPTIAAVSVLQILFIGGAMLLTDRLVNIGRVV